MRIALVVAAAENGVIGRAGALPWRLPADLRHFRQVTASNPVIMGRKTYDEVRRPLPGRRNIVITRQANLQIPGCDVVSSLPEALDQARAMQPQMTCIIGGAEIFRLAMPMAQLIYLTRVHTDVPGDTFFHFNPGNDWKEISREDRPPDAENEFAMSFLTYERVAPTL